MSADPVHTSKFLSFVLRHKPEAIGLALDGNGWADVDDLVRLAIESGHPLTRAAIETVVAGSDKQRFALSEDGRRIRANQGHSVAVDLGLSPVTPPTILYHGTATRFLDSIREHGLRPGSRQHVHLSGDEATAVKVAIRHGRAAVLQVAAGEMARDGFPYFRSTNGVWLTALVPVRYLTMPSV